MSELTDRLYREQRGGTVATVPHESGEARIHAPRVSGPWTLSLRGRVIAQLPAARNLADAVAEANAVLEREDCPR